MGVLDELLELEHAGWRSLCDGTGADFYGSIMTDDGVMVLAHGFTLDRSAVVASLNDAPPWGGYEIAGERVIGVGEDSAALVYQGRAWNEGEESEFLALMSTVYVRAGSSWKLALYQQTPVPQ